VNSTNNAQRQGKKRQFLGVHYVNCGIYGRVYKNKGGVAYVGCCPRCMTPIRIGINSKEGTDCRFFRFYCP